MHALLLAAAGLALGAPAEARGRWTTLEVASATVAAAAPPVEVLVYQPGCARTASVTPLVVALAGWNHPAKAWRGHSELARLADEACVTAAAPSLGQTVFETRWFPETRRRAGAMPGARWVGEVLVPALRRRLPVDRRAARTALIGYSTGGRGALMVAGLYGDAAFAASLSGTYALDALDAKTGEYRIHEVVYGPRAEHPARWLDESVTAPRLRTRLARVVIYAAHGDRDRVVPVEQLDALAAALGGRPPGLEVERDVGGAHDWSSWNRGLRRAFARMRGAFERGPP